MPRIHEIEVRLSALPQSRKNIVYLITEERDILQEVFSEAAATLKGIAGSALDQVKIENARFYKYLLTNHLLEDAYEVFPLMSDLLGCREKKESAAQNLAILHKAVFFFLTDFHIIQDKLAGHFLKQFLSYAQGEAKNKRQVYLFLVSPTLQLPTGFESVVDVIDVPEPDESDLRNLLVTEAKRERWGDDWATNSDKDSPALTETDQIRINRAARDFKGISPAQIRTAISDLQNSYGSFYGQSDSANGRKENLNRIEQARSAIIAELKRNSARHDSTVTLLDTNNSIVGLEEYCDWIDEIKMDILHPEDALEWGNLPPKGVLLTGVPGSGKTQAAKMTAARMGVSLVQFRMDNLLGGLVGDSEANFKRCRKRIEALAPCVVLIDEIEKIFGQDRSSGSHDVKMNILSAMLDWLQENDKPLFFYATSNDVSNLKPELLRDGRFDMRFCVFMPTHDELVQIFAFHMEQANKRAQGKLFQGFHYAKMAQEFLQEITKSGRCQNPNMFYTGANIENLIAQTNRAMRRQCHKPSQKEYQALLLQVALSERSQPYGVTNMAEITKFWLSACANQYANAGKQNLFQFNWFDADQSKFLQTPKTTNNYDLHLFERISTEICKAHQKSKQRPENY